MTDFKNIKHFNYSLDIIWHIYWLSESCYPPMLFGGGEMFFHWLFDDIDVESASKYVVGKHRILTTMNISDSRVIHIVIVLYLPLLTFIVHLKIISKLKVGTVSKEKGVSANADTSWFLSISGVIRKLMKVIRQWEVMGSPACVITRGYMIFMTWVISLNNLTVMW